MFTIFRNPQWSDDEKICARNVNNEVHFFEDANFGKKWLFNFQHQYIFFY